MAKVVITRPVPEAMAQAMQAMLPPGSVVTAADPATGELGAMVADADALIALGRIDAALLAAAPRLRFIQVIGAGFDHVDIAAAAQHGVPVANTPGANAVSVAEHTIMLMLVVLRGFREMEAMARGGGWEPPADLAAIGDLAAATVGLVGLGRIGLAVAERLHGFGPRLLYWARRPADEAIAKRLGLIFQPLDDLLAQSTILSLHVALNDETRGMIGPTQLATLPRGAILINTGRGELIDDDALRAAILSGHLAGAGLDVVRDERAGGNPFTDLPNVIVTPHRAGISRDAGTRMIAMTAENIGRVLRGEAPLWLVPGSATAVRRSTEP